MQKNTLMVADPTLCRLTHGHNHGVYFSGPVLNSQLGQYRYCATYFRVTVRKCKGHYSFWHFLGSTANEGIDK